MFFINKEITLLNEQQVRESNLLRKITTKSKITDFGVVLGAYVCDPFVMPRHYQRRERLTWWALQNQKEDYIAVIDSEGHINEGSSAERSNGIRPVIQLSDYYEITNLPTKEVNGIYEVEIGEYPQFAVEPRLGQKLETEYTYQNLNETGKTYTIDKTQNTNPEIPFKPLSVKEYEYQGKKYVRIQNRRTLLDFTSNGEYVRKNEAVWLEVEPITWYVDIDNKLLISKYCLTSGLRFCDDYEYNGNFKNTEVYMFLNNYFKKEINPSNSNQMATANTPRIKI